ncbi:hypothetical protein X798_07200 [Onchocerca flexuosa]|uniref:Uncharacterized protein n=1 Tax=Onchocerca flexuosa TaxID=387005 RepID=A0A238BL92_9BILA|nr:hypothetical protein X798_07200 [Onchocerca flexuosa]
MKKCRSAEFDVIMDHKNMSQETSEIVKKLKSKIESTQKIFNNTMNRIEIESIRSDPFDSDKVRMSAFVRYVQKRLQSMVNLWE